MARKGTVVQCLVVTEGHASWTKMFSDNQADIRRVKGIGENLRKVLSVIRRIENAILIDHNPAEAERLFKEELKFDETTAAQ